MGNYLELMSLNHFRVGCRLI